MNRRTFLKTLPAFTVLAGNFIAIKAQVALAEVSQYTSQLKSVTG